MKRFLFGFIILLGFQLSCVAISSQELITDENIVIYSPSSNSWTTGGIIEDGIVLTKRVQFGAGAYSQYFDKENKLSFTLTSDCEFIQNGLLVSVNNNELKFSKIIYTESGFEEVSLTEDEIQELFPDTEVIRISEFKNNKLSVHKKMFEKKNILLVNDTKKFYYNPTCILPKAQTSNIRGYITLYRYGKYSFKHFGERNGNFTIYVKL